MRVKLLGLTVLGLVVFVLVVVAFRFAESGGGRPWLAAMDRAIGLGLLLVTGAYVLLTFQMVSVLRRQPGQATVRALLSMAVPTMEQSALMLSGFPFKDDSRPPDPQELQKGSFGLDQVRQALTRAVPQVPAEIGRTVMDAESLFRRAVPQVDAFSVAVALEKMQAEQERRSWSWEGAKKGYLAEIQAQAPGNPTWEEVSSGDAWIKAQHAFASLAANLWSYLNR